MYSTIIIMTLTPDFMRWKLGLERKLKLKLRGLVLLCNVSGYLDEIILPKIRLGSKAGLALLVSIMAAQNN